MVFWFAGWWWWWCVCSFVLCGSELSYGIERLNFINIIIGCRQYVSIQLPSIQSWANDQAPRTLAWSTPVPHTISVSYKWSWMISWIINDFDQFQMEFLRTHCSIHKGFSVVFKSSMICFLMRASFRRFSVGTERFLLSVHHPIDKNYYYVIIIAW